MGYIFVVRLNEAKKHLSGINKGIKTGKQNECNVAKILFIILNSMLVHTNIHVYEVLCAK